MRRAPLWSWLPWSLLLWAACGKDEPAVNRVGVNVVEKAVFQDSWYMSRTVVDVDYEAAGLGTFPGDIASDAAMDFTALPRIRWVIDEHSLYAYRDYELVRGGDGDSKAAPGAENGKPASSLPVAAYKIEKHFDIRRSYNASTGEERNILEENDLDKPWYAREFMRVDWSKNLLPGYFGQTQNLSELLGNWKREPTDLYVQDSSKFPASYQPQFQRMRCKSMSDTTCPEQERDLAADYAKDELYHMTFVSQEILSPDRVADPETGEPINWCAAKLYSDAPACTSVVSYVRTSFLKVSDKRQYEPLNYVDSRFDRFGYFRLTLANDDRSTGAPDDPAFGVTDFRNYNMNRHNLWLKWRDDDGHSIPYAERSVRKVVWYSTPELPAHLVQPSFDVVGRWNEVFMDTVRRLRGEALPTYPAVSCQTENADGYCYCERDPDTKQLLNATCPGQYDPFKPPESYGSGVQDPYDCWVSVPDAAKNMNMDDAALSDADFNPWFKARFVGDECVTILRVNTCNKASLAQQTDKSAPIECQERGDLRYKFLSYVATPGTGFLGIATLRGDPETGEIIAGDANIGGPALDNYRTSALQTYDLIKGNLTDLQLQVGEDIRGYFENLGHVSLPVRPRSDFDVATRVVPASLRAEIDGRMRGVLGKLERLKGTDGRLAVLSDRRQKLIGTDLERRLVAGLDAQTDGTGGAASVSTGALTDAQLDAVSPLRTTIQKRLDVQREREERYSRANVTLANEYTDDSVQWFVSRHQDWSRARLEFEINRLLFRETELHEMGHCLGLRHDFGASADSENYRAEYYNIAERYPLPTLGSFDTDGTTGLSGEETLAFEQAYAAARSKREVAGIKGAMNSSVMEYTANWYERLQPLGKYDAAAIAFGYGDLVEAYDGAPTGGGPRSMLRYYQGGEGCTTDAQCPYSKQGERASDLLATNLSSGITQRCVDNAHTPSAKLCSASDDDLAAHAAQGGRLHPLKYRFCTDERADSTLAWCNRFDEGDTYREIVRNVEDSYDRMYVFSAFRRYRSDFSASSYADALLGRRLNILQNVYQNLIYEYLNDPSFRTQDGALGFYDQFLATTDILNFYARILAQPNVGGYRYNTQTGTYLRSSVSATAPSADLPVPLGLGRYFYSDYQSGLSGIERLERVGSFYDKARVIELLTQRGSSANYTRDVAFFANFYDLFPNEMQQIFTGMIRGYPQAYMPRVVCDTPSAGTKCGNARLVYMDFYRGDCTKPETCRPNPAEVTYGGLPVLDGGGSITLQVYAAINGLSDFPVYFDTTFQNQLFVCIEGQADCYQPDQKAVEGRDYVRYTSPRYRRTFVAFQVEPSQGVAEQTSIGFAMVKEARDLDVALDVLRKERDGAKPYSRDNLTQADLDALELTGYVLPSTPLNIDSELIRIENRVVNLESFFNQIIEIQRSLGIQGIAYFQ
jgi:hypothetical protein